MIHACMHACNTNAYLQLASARLAPCGVRLDRAPREEARGSDQDEAKDGADGGGGGHRGGAIDLLALLAHVAVVTDACAGLTLSAVGALARARDALPPVPEYRGCVRDVERDI